MTQVPFILVVLGAFFDQTNTNLIPFWLFLGHLLIESIQFPLFSVLLPIKPIQIFFYFQCIWYFYLSKQFIFNSIFKVLGTFIDQTTLTNIIEIIFYIYLSCYLYQLNRFKSRFIVIVLGTFTDQTYSNPI